MHKENTFGTLAQLRAAIDKGHRIDKAHQDTHWMDNTAENLWFENGIVRQLRQMGEIEIHQEEGFKVIIAVKKGAEG